ncbi:MAG: hypothetical protein K2L11_00545 [Muribaculaceae bacterium]|nr:hypothetical protein [Muribaculaceae bacterium]
MKKVIIPMAAMALLMASCDTDTKDSYQTMPYIECNLIIDNSNVSEPAQVSSATYETKINLSKRCVDIKASDFILDNQKLSFETDTMALSTKNFQATIDGKTEQVTYLTFGKRGSAGTGSSVTDLNGTFVLCYVPTGSDILNPNFNISYVERLDMSFQLNDRYSVQTFWPSAFYVGQTSTTSESGNFATNNGNYLMQIDFKEKKATVYLYNAQLSADGKELPKVIRFEEIPVLMSHYGFSLVAEAPKTTVLGKKDNKTEMVDSVGFAATDFSLHMTTTDLTEVEISYKIDGKNVNFHGRSTIK